MRFDLQFFPQILGGLRGIVYLCNAIINLKTNKAYYEILQRSLGYNMGVQWDRRVRLIPDRTPPWCSHIRRSHIFANKVCW